MLIDTLLKSVKTRYNSLVIDMNEDYNLLVQSGGKDSEVNTNLVWIDDIIETIYDAEEESFLDLAAASILKEEIMIEFRR